MACRSVVKPNTSACPNPTMMGFLISFLEDFLTGNLWSLLYSKGFVFSTENKSFSYSFDDVVEPKVGD